MIEWENAGMAEIGFVAGLQFCTVSWNGREYLLYVNGLFEGTFRDHQEAKAKAEELFTEWLDRAGLMVKPEKCRWCDNKGHYLGWRCTCTENPNSLYNVIKRLRG